MKASQSVYTYSLFLATLGVLLFAISCDNNPVSHDEEDHDHTEPYGFELIHKNETIIEYSNGTVTEHQHVQLHAGEEYLFEIHFIDEDGDNIHEEDLDEEYSLSWNIENETVFDIHQNNEDGEWEFHIQALAEGSSRIQFRLIHGSGESAHSDFETPAVTSDNAIEFHVEAEQ